MKELDLHYLAKQCKFIFYSLVSDTSSFEQHEGSIAQAHTESIITYIDTLE